MKANVLTHRILEKIPSSSGIEFYDDKFYVIGDNSAWLYVLNSDFEIIDVKEIYDEPALKNGVIPKKKKADFESLTMVSTEKGNRLLILGSGSKSPERDKAFFINPENLLEKPEEFSLTELYSHLRGLEEISKGFKLNIEGAASSTDKIFLFQRGNISGNNVMIRYDQRDFINFLNKKTDIIPLPDIKKFNLPDRKGLLSGFSGATLIPESEIILFTATVEDTNNEIDDGITVCNYIGLIDLNNIKTEPDIALVMMGEDVFTGKIESIAPILLYENYIKAIAVTDNDGEESEILELEISW